MQSKQFSLSPSASLQISELGFGCAAVSGRVSRKDSLRALSAAFDHGITFYDTARSYGYGQGESVVGEFLQGRRASVVVCTKFGILPSSSGGWKRRLKPLAQAAVRVLPGLRSIAQAQTRGQLLNNQFSPDVLHSSLETSLRELKTDYVDMLLLHAAPASVLHQQDLLDALARIVESGKARIAGISADIPVIEKYFEMRPPELSTAQFALNLGNIGFAQAVRENSDLFLVGNHPFGGPTGASAAKATLQRLRDAVDLPAILRDKFDLRDPQLLPELVLNCVLRGTGLAAVVPAMMQLRHIESNVAAVTNCRFTDDELDLLREHLGKAHLPAAG